MKRKCIILCFSFFFLTGCWSKKELNEIAINLAIGIDKVDDEYLVSCQVVNPGEVTSVKSGSGRSPVILFQVKSKNLSTAMRKITTLTPRRIYWAHIRILVIGEDVAKEGFRQLLDGMLRNPEVRSDFDVVIAKHHKAEDILKVLTSLEKIPAQRMISSLHTSQKLWAPTSPITINELVVRMMTPGFHSVITGITINGPVSKGEKLENVQKIKPNTNIQYINNAIFKNDRLLGWLNTNQSKGYSYIMNHVHSTIGSIPCSPHRNALIEVVKSKTNTRSHIKQGKPQIELAVRIKANLAETLCPDLNVEDPHTIHMLERRIEKKIEKTIYSAVYAAQKKYKVDIFGFSEYFHRSHPDYWKQQKQKWDEVFPTIPVHVKVHVKIQHTGTYKKSFLQKIK